MPKPLLKDFNIAISGNFGKDRPPEAFRRWCDNHGAKFNNAKIEPGVTHLICSMDNYKSPVQAVAKAERLKIPVVTYDWFEDVLQDRKKHRPSGKYLCKNAYDLTIKEKRKRAEREREVLKENGTSPSTSPKHNPDTAAGMASNFFGKHLEDLNDKGRKKRNRKPDVEEYKLFDKINKPSSESKSGSESNDGKDGGRSDDGSARDRADTPMQDAEVSTSKDDENTSAPDSAPPPKSSAPANDAPAEITPSPEEPEEPAKSPPVSHKSLEGQSEPSKSSPKQLPTPSVESAPVSAPSEPVKTSSPKNTARSSESDTLSRLGKAVAARKRVEQARLKALIPQQPLQPIRPRLRAYNTDTSVSDLENHHLYRDTTGFTYNILLIRIEAKKNSNERFHLRLYESHTTPRTYAVHIKYHQTRKQLAPTASVLALGDLAEEGTTIASVGSEWETAWKVFRETFAHLTGLSWEERFDMNRRGVARQDYPAIDGDLEKYFKYMPPKEGEPIGRLPPPSGAAATL